MPESERPAGGAPFPAPEGADHNGAGEEAGFFPRLRRLVARGFQERPLLSWLLVLLLVLVLLFRVVLPLVDYLDRVRRDTAELRASLASYQNLIQRRQDQLARRRARMEKLEGLGRDLPALTAEQARQRLLRNSRALLERAGLRLGDTRFLPGRAQGRYLQVSLRLRAEGDYQGIEKFLAACSRAPGLMHLRRFAVYRLAGGGPLRLECEVAGLVRR